MPFLKYRPSKLAGIAKAKFFGKRISFFPLVKKRSKSKFKVYKRQKMGMGETDPEPLTNRKSVQKHGQEKSGSLFRWSVRHGNFPKQISEHSLRF